MKFSGLLLTLAISPLAFSGEIITGNNIQALNGNKVKSAFVGNQKLEAKDGKQQLAVRYSASINNDRLIESRPYLLTIDVDGKTTISTDKFYSKVHAEQLMKAGLTWYVTNDQGKYTVAKATELKGEGFLPYSDIEGLIAESNQQNNIDLTSGSVKKVTTNSLIEEYKAANVKSGLLITKLNNTSHYYVATVSATYNTISKDYT